MDSRDFCGFLWVSGEFLQISVEFNGFLENFYGFSKMDFDGSLENFNGFENLYGFDVVVSMPLPTFHGDMKKTIPSMPSFCWLPCPKRSCSLPQLSLPFFEHPDLSQSSIQGHPSIVEYIPW